MDAKWWKQCDPKLSERGRVIESYVEEGKGDSRVTGIPGSLEGESVGMSTANLGLPISRYFLCAWLGSALRFQSSHCCYQREGVHILCTVGSIPGGDSPLMSLKCDEQKCLQVVPGVSWQANHPTENLSQGDQPSSPKMNFRATLEYQAFVL